MSIKSSWSFLRETFNEFGEDRVLRLSAAMAYYAIFSIGPLLVLIVGVAGLVLGEEKVRQEVGGQLASMVGESSAKMVESMMAPRKGGTSLIATVIGGIGLIIGASGVFGQLQDALNTIWEVKAKPGAGIWGLVRSRFLSMTTVLGIGFLLLVSMVLSAALSAVSGRMGNVISLPGWVAQGFGEVFSFVVITVLFAMIFKVLPDIKIRWRDVWVGAAVTAALFTLGKFALGKYLGSESTASAYGAGSAFVLVLLYIYYSSVILFYGAEFTQVFARRSGSVIEPSKYAVPVSEEERANEGMPRTGKGPGNAGKPGKAGSPGKGQSAWAPAYVSARAAGSERGGSSAVRKGTPGPLAYIREEPWSFIGLALTAGLAAGLGFRFRFVRKAVAVYFTARKALAGRS